MGSSQIRDQTRDSFTDRQILYHRATGEALPTDFSIPPCDLHFNFSKGYNLLPWRRFYFDAKISDLLSSEQVVLLPKLGLSRGSLQAEWGGGGRLAAVFPCNTLGGLGGKARSPLAPGGQRRLQSHPASQPSTRSPFKQRGRKRREMPINPSKPLPPAASRPEHP